MPDEYLDNLQAEERTAMWFRMVSTPRLGSATLVVEDDAGAVADFAAFGPESGKAEVNDVGELYAINLDPNVWRQGLGRLLLRAATSALTQAGFSQAVLWVLPGNYPATRLYTSEGWVADGTARDQDVLGVTAGEARFRRDLAVPALANSC